MAEKSVTFTRRHLLIVEGVDEEKLLINMLNHLEIESVHVWKIDGIKNLPAYLKLFPKIEGFSNIERIAILVDSDDDPASRHQSICSSLKAAKLPVPTTTDTVSTGYPGVIYSTLPGPDQAGCLEDLLNKCLNSHASAKHVHTFLSGVGLSPAPRSSRWSKSWLHSCLSTFAEPGKKIGEATKAGYIDVSHAELLPIREFIGKLVA